MWDWQSLQPTSGPGAVFFDFCDALEVKDGVSADANGWGLEHALPAWGAFWNSTYYALSESCFLKVSIEAHAFIYISLRR